MKSMIQNKRALGIVLVLAVAAGMATVARADCYRYLSGDAQTPEVDESCVEALSVPRIFVRMTEDGYDLLIPNPTQDHTALPSRRAAAAVEWLGTGSNLASTQTAVETMINDGAWPLGIPVFEQLNYSLATWLNTSGATTSITNIAGGSGSGWPEPGCIVIPQCTSCQLYFHLFGRWRCTAIGNDCCVIKKIIVPNE